MTITLHKHHGLGNDFLIALGDDAARVLAANIDPAAVARSVCDRRRGIGADGLMLVAGPSEAGEWTMTLYNADGSRAEISGNGIRCVAQAIARHTGSLEPVVVNTDAGTRTLTLSPSDDPETVAVRVAMGPVGVIDAPAGWAATGCHPDRPVAHLSLGNPHSVVAVDDVAAVDLAALGAQLPDVNLEIVEPGPHQDEVRMRVHERGAGITEACGTGACAVAYAARSWGLVRPSAAAVTVHMDGGSVEVELIDPDVESGTPAAGTAAAGPETHAVLTGPATYVASVRLAAPADGAPTPRT